MYKLYIQGWTPGWLGISYIQDNVFGIAHNENEN